jgi:hypothetical protein
MIAKPDIPLLCRGPGEREAASLPVRWLASSRPAIEARRRGRPGQSRNERSWAGMTLLPNPFPLGSIRQGAEGGDLAERLPTASVSLPDVTILREQDVGVGKGSRYSANRYHLTKGEV